jgi:hypothetical protein
MTEQLNWGIYPQGLEYDAGGETACGEEGIAPKVIAADAERAAYAKRNMEERGGNNAYLYETTPKRLRYAYGVGCMNPECKCHNCQGSCSCAEKKPPMRERIRNRIIQKRTQMFSSKLALLIALIILVAVAVLLYKRIVARR